MEDVVDCMEHLRAARWIEVPIAQQGNRCLSHEPLKPITHWHTHNLDKHRDVDSCIVEQRIITCC